MLTKICSNFFRRIIFKVNKSPSWFRNILISSIKTCAFHIGIFNAFIWVMHWNRFVRTHHDNCRRNTRQQMCTLLKRCCALAQKSFAKCFIYWKQWDALLTNIRSMFFMPKLKTCLGMQKSSLIFILKNNISIYEPFADFLHCFLRFADTLSVECQNSNECWQFTVE